MPVPLLVAVAVLVSAALSGALGMAGGLLLMECLVLLLPVSTAMVVHGVTQFASNGFRAWLLRDRVRWPVVGGYLIGALAAVPAGAVVAARLERFMVFFALGALVLVASFVRPARWLTVESPPVAVLGGFVVTAAQLVAGVAGPVLDLLFVHARMDRHQVVATKAVTQAAGHALKIGLYLALFPGGVRVPVWLLPMSVALAFLGTRAGTAILDQLAERTFRRTSLYLVRALAVLALAEGVREGAVRWL